MCFTDSVFYYIDHVKLWNGLREMGIPEYLIILMRNLGQEATVRTEDVKAQ